MSSLRRGLRAELAAIFDVDQYSLEDVKAESAPPTEPTSMLLASIIHRSSSHQEEARTIYEFLPILMLRMLGYGAGYGWLETASELPSKDRDALVRLIMPEGPVHTFCKKHSPPREGKLNIATDMRFEFLRSNLPVATNDALEEEPLDALKRSIKDDQSFLAPFLASSLKNGKDEVVYLSPLDYFYICMIASPAQKWTPPSGSQPPGRRLKRSVSLPSTRALYNHVIASYASSLTGTDRVDKGSVFIATCLDFLFVPWSSSKPSSGLPVASTAAAEAVASLLLALVPARPSNLDLVVDFRPSGIPQFLDWRMQTNTSALYRAAESMLESVLKLFESSAPYGTLIVYIRILALYISPWRTSIRNTLKGMLFPKQKSSSSSAKGRAPAMVALSSRLSSINAHLASSTRSPGNASSVKESQWRAELRTRQKFVDEELVRLAIVKAANRRLPSCSEGAAVLVLLADATVAARLSGNWSSPEKDQDKAEELRSCLLALRIQKSEYEKVTGKRDKNYIGLLASSLGIRLENGGMLSGISEIVGAGGAGGVAGVVNMVAGSAAGNGSGFSARIRERRLSALRGEERMDVPFLGNVWDRPIAESENEVVVLWLYWLALRLEPRLGFVPNLRFLGRYWILLSASIVVCTAYLIRRIVQFS